MNIGTKLGIASVVFFVGTFACSRFELGMFLCIFFAALLGTLAGVRGHKVWFVVPALTIAIFAIFVWAGINAS